MIKTDISIIVPVYNEKGTITALVERIHNAFSASKIAYSIVTVDDRSDDGTLEILLSLKKKYPLTVLQKKESAPRGKSSSILAGFEYSKDIKVLAMIDADLQYEPEELPAMYRKIVDGGADVVVAKRTSRHIGLVRDSASYIFRTIFGKMLFNLPHDVQSGMKVFKSEVIKRFDYNPSRWMFDLEFLLHARDAGYTIVSHDISFNKRTSGEAKIHVVSASLEMAAASIKRKFKESKRIPSLEKSANGQAQGFHFKGKPYVNYTDLPHKETALISLSRSQIGAIVLGVIIFSFFMILNWQTTSIVIVGLLTILYFIDLIFNAYIVSKSLRKQHDIVVTHDEIISVDQNNWPMYTVFCPLYKEWHVLPQFIKAMRQLDYPKDKLEIMLLLEQDDTESIENIGNMVLPDNFVVNVVPHSKPKTKPKALNFGLLSARGEFAVIYDAEDIPDPLQLKKTVLAFRKSNSDVVCMQSKLNFYNPGQNLLTRIFTAEYSLWFDLILPGLQAIKAPIPLGGTSNHFRIQDLKELSGWDAFNVTEDCDLGIRIAKKGYKTAIVDSTTMEEANSRMGNWYGQRSRWIKGYIQTYFVHSRDLGSFSRTFKKPDVLTFQLVVGGKILSMLINPFMWLVTISYFAFRATLGPVIDTFYPTPILYMGVLCLVFGNLLYVYYYMIGCAKRGYFDLIKYALVTPFYWLFMSVSAWRAILEVIVKPHYWSKTNHGFHLQKKKTHKHKKTTPMEHILTQYTGGVPKVKINSMLPTYCDILHS